ncbi:MAG: hypothetical protein PG981_000326 [Wolbachia endosymbiont of Ctenocephalides orientis wCori]|nr:MAG: hypothetical protein PG981_000326 [Wolbachia endosymbiont of Ctenocephalides orientis wCori]
MPNFFTKSFEEQIKTAIDNNDPKLVQVLLGPKYCQLWQYWQAHSMISYIMLFTERRIQCTLPLKMIEKQNEILSQASQY